MNFISHVKSRLLNEATDTVPTSEELVGEFFNLVEPPTTRNNYAALAYIKGLTETLQKKLKKHDNKVYKKPQTCFNRNSPVLKIGQLKKNPTSYTRSDGKIALGTTSGKQVDVLTQGKRHT